MHKLIISVGSNCGRRRSHMMNAFIFLRSVVKIIRQSSIYETPCARKEGPRYLNAVMECESDKSLNEIHILLKNYEIATGRTQQSREKGEVPIDIDIVIFNGDILREWDAKQKFFRIGYDSLRNASHALSPS